MDCYIHIFSLYMYFTFSNELYGQVKYKQNCIRILVSQIINSPKRAFSRSSIPKKGENMNRKSDLHFHSPGNVAFEYKHRISSAYILPFNECMKIRGDSILFFFSFPFFLLFKRTDNSSRIIPIFYRTSNRDKKNN